MVINKANKAKKMNTRESSQRYDSHCPEKERQPNFLAHDDLRYGIGDVPIEVEISSLKQTIFDVVSFTLNTFLVSLGDNKNNCPETQIF